MTLSSICARRPMQAYWPSEYLKSGLPSSRLICKMAGEEEGQWGLGGLETFCACLPVCM